MVSLGQENKKLLEDKRSQEQLIEQERLINDQERQDFDEKFKLFGD